MFLLLTETTCPPKQFRCDSGQCIPNVWVCDNDNDCMEDGADERANCTDRQCPDDHFKCPDTGRCIPKSWVCDGDKDCAGIFI